MSERTIHWTQVSRGLYFAGFGILFLLTTKGALPWSFWREALTCWPVALVAVGLRLVFERSRIPWAVLLSPLLVLGTLTYLALRGPLPWADEWRSLEAARPAEAERWTFDGRLVAADINIRARPLTKDRLVEGRMSPSVERPIRVTGSGDATRVRIGTRRVTWIVPPLPHGWLRYDLDLTQDLPLAVQLDLALAHGDVDLAAVRLTDLDLGGALNDLTVELGAPTSDVRMRLDGAFNRIVLVVPPETPVRTSTDGFLNRIKGRRNAGTLEGPGYRLNVDGMLNRIVIRSD